MAKRVSVRRHALQAAKDVAATASASALTGQVMVRCAVGGLVCEVRVGPSQPRPRSATVRAACKADVLAVIGAADRPLPRLKVIRALRAVGKPHGAGTVAKALADLTRERALVNPRDKRGYRLPGWPDRGRPDQPALPGL